MILSNEEENLNRQVIESLKSLIGSGEAVLFVGSGTSMRLNYPSWPSLLEKLEALATGCGTGFTADATKRDQNPLDYADDIKRHILKHEKKLDIYHAKLRELFKPTAPPFDEFHLQLVSLPFSGIVTTNYDTILSSALRKIEEGRYSDDVSFTICDNDRPYISEFLLGLNRSLGYRRKVAHLHGRYNASQGIILSKSDYEEAYDQQPPKPSSDVVGDPSIVESEPGPAPIQIPMHRNLIWALLGTRRVIFLGFGMRDPYIKKLLNWANADLWRWDNPTHFFITHINEENGEEAKARAKELKERYSVNTVFYPAPKNDHSAIERLVEEFVQACNPRTSSPISPSSNEDAGPPTMAIRRAVELASGSANPDSSVWLKSVNDALEAEERPHED